MTSLTIALLILVALLATSAIILFILALRLPRPVHRKDKWTRHGMNRRGYAVPLRSVR